MRDPASGPAAIAARTSPNAARPRMRVRFMRLSFAEALRSCREEKAPIDGPVTLDSRPQAAIAGAERTGGALPRYDGADFTAVRTVLSGRYGPMDNRGRATVHPDLEEAIVSHDAI